MKVLIACLASMILCVVLGFCGLGARVVSSYLQPMSFHSGDSVEVVGGFHIGKTGDVREYVWNPFRGYEYMVRLSDGDVKFLPQNELRERISWPCCGGFCEPLSRLRDIPKVEPASPSSDWYRQNPYLNYDGEK